MLPIPFQMIPAGVGAFFAKVNIPAAITSVWVTNPVTWPIILFWQYKLGGLLLGGALDGSDRVWALLIGCLVTGVVAGGTGWAGCHLLWVAVSRLVTTGRG